MNRYTSYLRPGESVADIDPVMHGSQEWAYGYNFGKIENNTHEAGNSVVLDVEPGGAVEPVLITSDITLDVKALQGRGYAVIYNIEGADGVRIIELDPSKGAITFRKGDAYYYLNTGEDNLILRDDSTPAFQDGDEIQLTTAGGRNIALPNVFWLGFELLDSHEGPYQKFEAQLDRAFANPLHITLKSNINTSPEDLAHREQYFSPMASRPEDIKIRTFENSPQEYEVSTVDPAQYLLLLAQALRRLEITKGLADPGLEITPELEKVVKHETTHGKMAQAFGMGSRFGVRVLYDPTEDIWALSPFHDLVGDYAGTIMLTRLEEAAIAVAPEDASTADLHIARSLGYTNREDVLERLYRVRPDLHTND